MCPLEHVWPARHKSVMINYFFMDGGRVMSRLSCYGIRKTLKDVVVPIVGFFYSTQNSWSAGCRMCIPSYYTTLNHLYKFRLKNVEAPLRVCFREISRYSRHWSSAEPDVGCVYHHTIQRWTIYISSDSKTLKRHYGLAFDKISRYSRHSSSTEPDVGCVYHHTIQRWTIYICSD